MSVVELEISKNWFGNTTVLPSNWDRIRDPLIIFGSNTNRNLEQFAKDAFGLTYSIDNDGNANLSTDLQTQILNISLGATPFQAAVDGDYYAIQCNNTQANGAGSTNETVNLRFGFGTDGSIGRFGFGKEQDYTSAANSDSFFFIQTDLNGALGERFRITSGGNVGINATTRLYLDGSACTGNTYIYESAADNIIMVAGATPAFQVANGTVSVLTGNALTVAATSRLYFDGGVNTYIYESAADTVGVVANTRTVGQFFGGAAVANDYFAIQATSRLYFDGGVNTYIYESAADNIIMVAGATPAFQVANGTVSVLTGNALTVAATSRLYFDGGGDTYIYESSANVLSLVVGGVTTVADFTTIYTAINYDLRINATRLLYLDGGSDTYIYESAANVLDVYVGGTNAQKINSAGEVLFPDVDPPTANYANRNGIVKAWLHYTDNSGVVTNSYNIASVTDDDGDGVYNFDYDTDLASAVSALLGCSTNATLFATTVDVALGVGRIILYNDAGGAVDGNFAILTMGDQ